MKKNIQTKCRTYQLTFMDKFFVESKWTEDIVADCLEGAILELINGIRIVNIVHIEEVNKSHIKVEYELSPKLNDIIDNYSTYFKSLTTQISHIKYREL